MVRTTRLPAITLAILCLLLTAQVLAGSAPRQFALPTGMDRSSPESVLNAANAAFSKSDWLVAEVLFRRLLDLMPGDLLATQRLQELGEHVVGAKASLSNDELLRYDRFVAKVLRPEELAKVPAMKAAMQTFHSDGKIAEASSYADGILRILPNDPEARAIQADWVAQEIAFGDKALEANDIQGASAHYAKVASVDPVASQEKMKRVEALLGAHDALLSARGVLQKAIDSDNEDQIHRAVEAFPTSTEPEPLLAKAKDRLAYFENVRSWSHSRFPVTVFVSVYRDSKFDINVGRGATLQFSSLLRSFGSKNMWSETWKINIPSLPGGHTSISGHCRLKLSNTPLDGSGKSEAERTFEFVNSPKGTWLSIDCSGGDIGQISTSYSVHDSTEAWPAFGKELTLDAGSW